MEHYVIINDYKSYHEGSVDILGVEHSLEDAKQSFKNNLPLAKRFASQNDFNIIEDTEVCFVAECEEEWSGNYMKLYIQAI